MAFWLRYNFGWRKSRIVKTEISTLHPRYLSSVNNHCRTGRLYNHTQVMEQVIKNGSDSLTKITGLKLFPRRTISSNLSVIGIPVDSWPFHAKVPPIPAAGLLCLNLTLLWKILLLLISVSLPWITEPHKQLTINRSDFFLKICGVYNGILDFNNKWWMRSQKRTNRSVNRFSSPKHLLRKLNPGIRRFLNSMTQNRNNCTYRKDGFLSGTIRRYPIPERWCRMPQMPALKRPEPKKL